MVSSEWEPLGVRAEECAVNSKAVAAGDMCNMIVISTSSRLIEVSVAIPIPEAVRGTNGSRAGEPSRKDQQGTILLCFRWAVQSGSAGRFLQRRRLRKHW